MKAKIANLKSKFNGFALVMAVIMVVLLALIGIGLIRLGLEARLQSIRAAD